MALSRVRSLEGLNLLGINTNGLNAHPLVLRADAYFREQSQIISNFYHSLTEQDLVTLHEAFVKAVKGRYTVEAMQEGDDARGEEAKTLKGEKANKSYG